MKRWLWVLLVFVIAFPAGAFAQATFTGLDIVDGSIKTVDLGKGSVKTGKLAAGAVRTGKIADESISLPKLDPTVLGGTYYSLMVAIKCAELHGIQVEPLGNTLAEFQEHKAAN